MASAISSYAWKGMANYKNDIEKYLRGEMTPAEMNALEKKALNDPFLADALEGAQQLPTGDFAADLHHLQQSLDARIQKKNAGLVWFGRIAAGLLLLALSTYIIVLISSRSNEKASENLALNRQQEAPAAPHSENAPLPSDSTTLMEDGDQPATYNTRQQNRRENKETPRQGDQSAIAPVARDSEEKPKTNPDFEEKDEEHHLAEPETIAEIVQPEQEIVQAGPEDSAPPGESVETDKKKEDVLSDDEAKGAARKSLSATPSKALSSSHSYTVNRKIIRGKVTFSEDGKGLPGVNVLVKGSNEGTVTDDQGNYQIAVEGTRPTLLFSFIGFTNQELVVESDQLDVQLDADVSELSEVVVVGYGADGADRSSAPTVMELATPEGGRKAFKQYLEKNLRYPEQALKNEVEGKVTIQFSIGMTGQLTDFRVIKGIGSGCDEEVIRLIKSGPKWYPTKKNEEPIKDRVSVRMRFALPKK